MAWHCLTDQWFRKEQQSAAQLYQSLGEGSWIISTADGEITIWQHLAQSAETIFDNNLHNRNVDLEEGMRITTPVMQSYVVRVKKPERKVKSLNRVGVFAERMADYIKLKA